MTRISRLTLGLARRLAPFIAAAALFGPLCTTGGGFPGLR